MSEVKILVPRLRFSEFRNLGEWGEMKLGDALNGESSQIAKNKLNIVEKGYPIYGADGFIGNIEFFSQDNDYIAVVKDGSGVGNLFLYKNKSSLLGTLTYLLSKDKIKYNLSCLYYLMQTIDFKPFVKGSGIPHIYYKDYSVLKIYLPQPEEQQKIANCLSSIDELITAQTQKIELLKAHKKGLMQQLFPAEGKTVPKLRFPEFDESLKAVGFAELGEIKIGLTHKPEYIKSGIPFLSSKNISNGYIDFENIKYISEEKFSSMPESTKPKIGDILFTRVGSNLGNPIILEEHREFGIFVSLGIFRVNKKVSNYYVKHWMDSNYFWEQVKQKVAGGAKDNLNTTWLKEFKLSIPLFSEQQKIADFLSSIDDLITVQTKKIESLKAHKKGLMQQLFPATDEVDA